jgi:nucleoside triphosphatase
LEETSLSIDNIKLVSVQESVLSSEFREEKHMVFLNYSMHKSSGEVYLNDEMEEYVWVEPQKGLETLDLNSSSRKFIEDYLGK